MLLALRNGAKPSQLARDYIPCLSVDASFSDSRISEYAEHTLLMLAKQYNISAPTERADYDQFLEDLIDAMTVAIAREARHPARENMARRQSNTESFNKGRGNLSCYV